MNENERQAARIFSEQVDRLLVGQMPLDAVDADDPLFALAAELAAVPALDPSSAFTLKLRQRLVSMATALPRRAPNSHLRRSFVGAAVTLLLALALVLVQNPGAPTVGKVLASAADAVAIAPGQIVHSVARIEAQQIVSGTSALVYNVIMAHWVRAGQSPDGRLTSTEVAGAVYAADDDSLAHPMLQHYATPTEICVRSLAPSISLPPELDHDGCVPFDASGENELDPVAPYTDENFRNWIARMQANVAAVEVHEDQFNHRPVYRLMYQEVGQWAQSPITANQTIIGALVAWNDTTPLTVLTHTLTVYVDRQTFLPVGIVSAAPDLGAVFTQTILTYQVLDPKDVALNPFTWPPRW